MKVPAQGTRESMVHSSRKEKKASLDCDRMGVKLIKIMKIRMVFVQIKFY